MSALKKGMYYREGRRRPSELFGLLCGQLRHRRIRAIKNAGWYNRRGEKLGWGDLSFDDLATIRDGLPRGEAFVVLGEQDSFWRFVTRIGGFGGASCRTRKNERAPGRRYVTERCVYVVADGRLFLVARYSGAPRRYRRRGLSFTVISADEAERLIAGTRQ